MSHVYYNTLSAVSVSPVAVAAAATINGNIIDTQGFEAGKVILTVGADTAGTIVITDIIEGNQSNLSDGSSIVTNNSQRIFGSSIGVAPNANSSIEVGFIPSKRYIKVVYTAAGGTVTLLASSVVELGAPHVAPTQQ